MSDIRYCYYPRTRAPPDFVEEVVTAFQANEDAISTVESDNGLKSDDVLDVVRDDMEAIGFEIEEGKSKDEKIFRPVLFGENGEPDLQYEVDGYHEGERYGLEVEASRAVLGNALYRDLIQAAVMVQVDTLVLVVPNVYRYSSGESNAYAKCNDVVDTVYASGRIELPFETLLIGY
ncbi:hypothetical protein [Halorubrum lipolyticum]|uniref:Uncharacterized protein n=1 Tax=Halorubrum lipolyticum DSM 21995 TaxID=1227482 RepID=M0P566_9EURY|nr:hypothetical protein [Halorubrum lipolyticum]EMA64674.1 hypothetical protein C469_00420 [Halorubrum lipolyticum DSM 21995]